MGDIPPQYRDQWGRYKLPHPVTGKPTSFQRTTTFNKLISNRRTLEQWGKRMVMVGLARRPDLHAQVQSMADDPKQWRTQLNQITEHAIQAAEAEAQANIGDALHRFTELVDTGQTVTVPTQFAQHIAAYRDTTAHLAMLKVEAVTCVPELGVAGTLDRIVTMPDGTSMIADLKTGDIAWSMGEIAMQLAIYAHGVYDHGPFNFTSGQWEDQIDVNLDKALIIHLPAETEPPRCDLWEVDIAQGWAVCQTALAVRNWQAESKTVWRGEEWSNRLALRATVPREVTPEAVPSPVNAEDLTDNIRRRIRTLAKSDRAKQLLTTNWPAHIPKDRTRPNSPAFEHDHCEELLAILTAVEAEVGAPFDPPTPKQWPTTRTKTQQEHPAT